MQPQKYWKTLLQSLKLKNGYMKERMFGHKCALSSFDKRECIQYRLINATHLQITNDNTCVRVCQKQKKGLKRKLEHTITI